VIRDLYKEDKLRRKEESRVRGNIKGFVRPLKLVLIRTRDLCSRARSKHWVQPITRRARGSSIKVLKLKRKGEKSAQC
jgi:hypothetical protein